MVDHLRVSGLAHRLDEKLPYAFSGRLAGLGKLVGLPLSDDPEDFDRSVAQANVVRLDHPS